MAFNDINHICLGKCNKSPVYSVQADIGKILFQFSMNLVRTGVGEGRGQRLVNSNPLGRYFQIVGLALFIELIQK